MPFCNQCGGKLKETAKFCNQCGNKISLRNKTVDNDFDTEYVSDNELIEHSQTSIEESNSLSNDSNNEELNNIQINSNIHIDKMELSLWQFYTKSIKQYVKTEGRASRKEIIGFSLYFFSISYGLLLLVFFTHIIIEEHFYYYSPFENFSVVFIVLFALFVLFNTIPCIATVSRRMHDIGKSGWVYWFFNILNLLQGIIGVVFITTYETLFVIMGILMLILFLVFSFFLVYYLFIKKGEETVNKYGINPIRKI